MSQFVGFEVQVELKDGKLITGKIAKATNKGLTLNNVKFSDGGRSQAFKVRSSRLKDLKVLNVAKKKAVSNNINANNANNNNKQRQISNEIGNGNANEIDWKNDDVEKIKQDEDFDFQGNLNLFNKKDIFNQLREYDNNNNITHVVNKDHYQNNEMIVTGNENVNNDEDEDEDDYEFDDIDDPNYLPITKSINITHLLHSAVSGSNDKDANSHNINTNNKDVLQNIENLLLNETLNKNTNNVVHDGQSLNSSTSSLQLQYQPQQQNTVKDSKTNQNIPLVTPIQLLEIERINFEKFHISTDSLAENFAINSSYFLKDKLLDKSKNKNDKNFKNDKNNDKNPLAVIIASDVGRSGLKAISLAKYLVQSNKIDVILLFVQSSFSNNADNNNSNKMREISENLKIFEKCGGKLIIRNNDKNKEGVNRKNIIESLKAIFQTLNNPSIELVIDGLQGFDCDLLDDFDTGLEYELIEILTWCNYQKNNKNNNSNCELWSIDFPSGYESSTGMKNFENCINHVDGILCSNWPINSLLNLHKTMDNKKLSHLVLVDTGIANQVYFEKNSFKKFQNIDLFVTKGHKIIDL
ncbi:Edc3p NDAI_0D01280 [Naumovozyma dairenensis CBS 421]|uniref:Enhancer of mRNA-decapping protein 3 n=1 Tax=Naumovozyma dairenensis (strain ATCC 10597 / BCRC 20456 / CBS 421 / NBRC 0211 / NRRL Y-12639) TaxID=1071378 RepID=G0W9I1_NAUDC|nr:hypothetical protein NDAI_0D01280 [Naumovozyma dairenensis CBS 421]CCD24442.1 hypothetical protein NDAI_0D01280 [Naumovozyma dairenensis CBS 421]